MNDAFLYKPKDTTWIKCAFFVDYNCHQPPVVSDSKVTGIKQLGFIASHEYDVLPHVTEARPQYCHRPGCDEAISYEFDVRFSVFDTFGFGLGVGKGTGTLGVTMKPLYHTATFQTRCACCHRVRMPATGERPGMAIQPIESNTAAVLALVGTVAGVGSLLTMRDAAGASLTLKIIVSLTGFAVLFAVFRIRHRLRSSLPTEPTGGDSSSRGDDSVGAH